MDNFLDDSIIEMFYFETEQLIEQMDRAILLVEESNDYSTELFNEILRAMHTIKGSAATMKFSNIAQLAHSIEDVLHYLREHKMDNVPYSELADIVLEGSDFIKVELQKLKDGQINDGNESAVTNKAHNFLSMLKEARSPQSDSEELELPAPKFERTQAFTAHLFFEEEEGMENVRAFTVVHQLKDMVEHLTYEPADIAENAATAEIIRKEGFRIWFKSTAAEEEVNAFFAHASNVKSIQLTYLESDSESNPMPQGTQAANDSAPPHASSTSSIASSRTTGEQKSLQQSMISVNVSKLDKLMDLVGELVISEAMVTQNPDLQGLELDNFMKSARQLHKITSEIQDMVMSIRMVPLTATFHKMQRIVRDMCKKLEKEVRLNIVGEDTEVDKNIIERISDPLMHVIRNAIDHGIEEPRVRIDKGKEEIGTLTLEAKNAGSDVFIIIRDDGRGLNKERILERARANGLIHRLESEMTDKEIHALIFLPGFSTKEEVSEFSGRGVGMDVVVRNIEAVGGSVWVESEQGIGSTFYFKIPLTLAIIDGMNIRVGSSRFTLPITAIKESFRAVERDIIHDLNEREMIMVRGQCYPILRLHERFRVSHAEEILSSGIMIMVESEAKTYCIFADELIGEQQVVVKTMPDYIRALKKISGLAGCTLLGDGSISLIVDVENLT